MASLLCTGLQKFYSIETVHGDFSLSYLLVEKLQNPMMKNGFTLTFTEKLSTLFHMKNFLVDFFESTSCRCEPSDNEIFFVYSLKYRDTIAIASKPGITNIEFTTLEISVTQNFQEIHAIGVHGWKVKRPAWVIEAESEMSWQQKFCLNCDDEQYNEL